MLPHHRYCAQTPPPRLPGVIPRRGLWCRRMNAGRAGRLLVLVHWLLPDAFGTHGKEIGPTVRLRALTNRHRRTGIRYPNSCGPLAPRVPEVMAACYILCLNLRQAPRAKDIIFAMRSGPQTRTEATYRVSIWLDRVTMSPRDPRQTWQIGQAACRAGTAGQVFAKPRGGGGVGWRGHAMTAYAVWM